MGRSRQREVVLEIEHVKIVRKRAKSNLMFCRDCGRTTDFLALTEAAKLFSTTAAALFEFSQTYVCHYRLENEQDFFLCLTDLLTAMGRKMKSGTVRLLGDSNS